MNNSSGKELPELPPEVTFREVKPDDYRAVLGIRDVFNGLDYMAAQYQSYMENPNVHCYILELNGEPVSFCYRFVVDDGENVVAGGGRTKKEYEGEGYLFLLNLYADDHLSKKLTNSTPGEVSTALDPGTMDALILKRNNKLLMRRQLQSFYSTKLGIMRTMSSSFITEMSISFGSVLYKPTKQEVSALLVNNKELFPKGRFIAVFELYKPIKSNFDFVYDTSDIYLSKDETSENIKAVSIISEMLCKNGLRYDFEFYGKSAHDMYQHLVNYLLKLVQSEYDTNIGVEMVLYFPLCLKTSEIKYFARQCGWRAGAWKDYPHYVAIEHPRSGRSSKL